jgi:hypothetical protein
MLPTLVCKKIIVAKSKEVKTGWSDLKTSLAESSKEENGSKRAVLLMMMMSDLKFSQQ